MIKKTSLLILPLCAALAVSACGVKPGTLWSPEQVEEHVETKKAPIKKKRYPATYPSNRSEPPPPPVTVEQNMPPI